MGLGPRTIGQGPTRHRRQTEARLVLGGFALIFLVGGGLLWGLYGRDLALIGLGVMIGALMLFALLLALLRLVEKWANLG